MANVKLCVISVVTSAASLSIGATVIGDQEWKLLSKGKSSNLYYSESMSAGDGAFVHSYYFVEDKAGKRHIGARIIANCKSSEYSLSEFVLIKKNIVKSKDSLQDFVDGLGQGEKINQANSVRPFHASNPESDLARLLCREGGFQKYHKEEPLEKDYIDSVKTKSNRKVF